MGTMKPVRDFKKKKEEEEEEKEKRRRKREEEKEVEKTTHGRKVPRVKLLNGDHAGSREMQPRTD